MINIGLPGWIFGVVLLPLPIAIAVAILNHGLYDLRRAAHRTLVWLTMSAAVAGIYAAVVITVAALVPDHHAGWPSLLAAALAALALIPLREKLQRGVTRVVYGRWHEPYEVLADLGEHLEAAADIDRLLDAVVAELSTGLYLRQSASAISTGPSSPASGTRSPERHGHRHERRPGHRQHSAAGLWQPGRLPDLPGAGSPAERGRGAAAG